LPMVECSRVFDTINLRLDLTVDRVFRAGIRRRPNPDAEGLPAAQENSSSKMEKYMTRPQELENISYLEIVKKYQWKANVKRWDRRRKEAIVLINPSKWYESLRKDPSKPQDGHSPDNPQYQVATRRALMLYVPFRTLSDAANWGQFAHSPIRLSPLHRNDDPQRWPICFASRLLYTPEIFPEFIRRLWLGNQPQEVPNEEDDEWDPTPDIPRRRDQEWQTAARTRANQMIGRPRDYFGNRDIDRLHDWKSDLRGLDLPANSETFLTIQRHLAGEIEGGQEVVHPEMLNPGQRQVYDFVVGRLADSLQGVGTGGECVIIMGRGGVGKSFLIRALEHGIWQTLMWTFGDEKYPSIRRAVKLAAFTGKAAYQVGGVTIHSLFGIGRLDREGCQMLRPEQLRLLQQDLRNARFLFLDEMSMIGLKLLSAIDTRLRQIFPQNFDRPFGGLTVVLFGDLGQLPPVLDYPLYGNVNSTSQPVVQAASRLYRMTFTQVFELTQQMRQQGLTAEDQQFQHVLSNLRDGRVEKEDRRFLQTRVLVNLPLQEREAFKNAIHLFPLVRTVDDKNIEMLEILGAPVTRIEAKYVGLSSEDGSKVDSEYCGNLEHILCLSVGCRVRYQGLHILILGDVNQKCMANKRPLQRRIGDSPWTGFQGRSEAT